MIQIKYHVRENEFGDPIQIDSYVRYSQLQVFRNK